MNRLLRSGVLALTLAGSCGLLADTTVPAGPCYGHFPNLITDICWYCVFPISIGPATVTMNQYDDGQTPPLICECPAPPPVFERIGVGISYWEPARLAEVVRTPYCSTTLGSTLSSSSVAAGTNTKNDPVAKNSFYQVHWYTFPLLSWIGAAFTSVTCEEDGDSFDLSYVTELDPMWGDDSLTTLIDPEAALFESLPAQGACIADSIAAAVGFGIDELFWCSGSQGSVYPVDGTIAHHVGGVDSSMLEIHRLLFKLHRMLVAQDTSTEGAMCGQQPQPIMRKGQYKLSQLFPIPKTDVGVPFGQQTSLWVSGHEYPYQGEDFSQLVWRKRMCCAYRGHCGVLGRWQPCCWRDRSARKLRTRLRPQRRMPPHPPMRPSQRAPPWTKRTRCCASATLSSRCSGNGRH